MSKFQKSENEKYFQQVIKMTKEGGQYIWPALMTSFTVKNGKLITTNPVILKAARSHVSKKAGLRLFTIEK